MVTQRDYYDNLSDMVLGFWNLSAGIAKNITLILAFTCPYTLCSMRSIPFN